MKSKRLMVIGIITALLISSIPFTMQQAAAYDAYGSENITPVIGEKQLFYLDFSDEEVGYFEAGYINGTLMPSGNRTVDVYNTGEPDHGKVLRVKVSGETGMVNNVQYRWDTGHVLSTGIVFVDYDLKLDWYGGGSGGLIRFGMYEGLTYATDPTFRIDYGFYATYIKYINNIAVTFPGTEYKNEWTHVRCVTDFDNDVVSVYVNNTLVSTKALEGDYISHFYMLVGPITTLGYYRQALIDNISISKPCHEVEPFYNSADNRTAITFTFDDNPLSVYENAYPNMTAYGYTGTIAVVSTWVGGVSKTTWAQLDEMALAGWELAAHSYDHTNHALLNEAQLRSQYEKSRDSIIENTSQDIVSTYIYPYNGYSNLAIDVASDYFEIVGAPGYDLTRHLTANHYFERVDAFYEHVDKILCTKYSYGGYVELYSHGAVYDYEGSTTDMAALDYVLPRLYANNSKVITPSESVLYRNARIAEISGNSTNFQVAYPAIRSFDNTTVSLRLDGNWAEDTYVVLQDGDVYSRITYSGYGGPLIVTVEEGDYKIMTLSDYNSQVLNDAISPIFAILPLVIIVSVIPMVMGLGRKLK